MSIRILPVFNINARIYFISFSFEILNIFFNIFQIGKYIYIYIYVCVCVCIYIYIYLKHCCLYHSYQIHKIITLFVLQPTNAQLYVTTVSLYKIYIPTCFDIFISSSGSVNFVYKCKTPWWRYKNVETCSSVYFIKWFYCDIQSVPGGKVNTLGRHCVGHSKQKCLYEHVSYSERFPR